MKYITELTFEVDEEIWNDHLKQNKHSTAFQTSTFYQGQESMENFKQFFISVKNENNIVGQLTGIIQLYEYSRTGNKKVNGLLKHFKLGKKILWDHGPIIFAEDNQKEIIKKICEVLENLIEKYDIDYIRGSSLPDTDPNLYNSFKKHNFETTKWSSFILDLEQTEEMFFNKLNKKTRYDIKKIENKQIEFFMIKTRKELDDYAKFKDSLRTSGNPEIHSEEIRNKIWNIWFEKGLRKIFLAKFENNIIGAISITDFNGNLYQTSVVNGTSNMEQGTFLLWNLIKWGIKNGKSTLDLGGTNPTPVSKKEEGIKFFKKKWGGNEVPQTIFLKIRNKNKLKISKALAKPQVVLKKLKMSE